MKFRIFDKWFSWKIFSQKKIPIFLLPCYYEVYLDIFDFEFNEINASID